MPLIPGLGDYVATPASPTVTQNAFGTGAAISYSVVAVNGLGQDTPPSVATVTPATNAGTANNTLTWSAVPGAAAYKVIKNGNLLASVMNGTLTYQDSAGSSGVAYTASTVNPPAVPVVAPAPYLYSAAGNGITLPATATDVAVISGVASYVIRVLHVEYSGLATTILETSVRLMLRTTADSGGTSANNAAYAHDQQSPASQVANVLSYGGGLPTVNDGTNRPLRSQKVLHNLAAPTAASESSRVVWDFGPAGIALRGTAQQLAINLNGVSVAGGTFDFAMTWSEERV